MKEKKSIISQLIELSKVDGKISEDEIALIKKMGNMIGLKDAEILPLFEQAVPFTPPASSFDRITQFHRLTLLMNIDGKASEEEKVYLKFAGIKLGLNEQAIHEILNRMYEFPNNMIPSDVLIEIHKKYMN